MPSDIVVLDGYALNPGDLSWDSLRQLGEVRLYDRTPPDEVAARARGAQIALTNKAPFREATLEELPDLRYIGVLATGYDIVDTKAAAARGIVVTNVPTYGTYSVAQFTFALILELCHRVQRHADHASTGGWVDRAEWSYHIYPLVELAGKTLGLVGYGRIGRQTAEIARAFGMQVIVSDPADSGSLPVDDLLRQADVVSLHCPLTPETRGLINADRLKLMKPSAFLINTARGPLIEEDALAEALTGHRLAGAAVDVLPTEPPRIESPLMRLHNCIVTPHIAWATKEARGRLMDIAVENVRAFLAGEPVNVVNRT